MGCWVSYTGKSAAPSLSKDASRSQRSKQNISSPRQPVVEEETVKEVLSETTTPKPNTIPKIQDESRRIAHNLALHKIRQERVFEKNGLKKSKWRDTDNVSETSWICNSTLSESISTATLTDKRDDDLDGEAGHRLLNKSLAEFRNRSFSGGSKRERVAGKSPARRYDISPGLVKITPGRERRRSLAEEERKDSCDGCGRRSSSPGTRANYGSSRAFMGRSTSGISGKSPSRVGSEWSEKNYGNGNEETKWPPTSEESLENPLVSLECFIFL